ncbi:MAG: HAD family phosphatase [Casimicrobiaceae bacterium]
MRAVIFDMDGLMLDTEPLAARAWHDAATTLGIAFDHAVTMRLIGRNFTDCHMLIRAHHGEDYPVDDLMQGWQVAYDAIVARDGIAMKSGLVELLDWLERVDIAKAVATSTRRSRALVKLEHANLLHRFTAVVGGDEVAHGKPAPDIFLAAASRLGVAPRDCVVLEDSEPGVRAALAGGMAPIMVPDLLPAPTDLGAADLRVLSSLHDVRRYLESRHHGGNDRHAACDNPANMLRVP